MTSIIYGFPHKLGNGTIKPILHISRISISKMGCMTSYFASDCVKLLTLVTILAKLVREFKQIRLAKITLQYIFNYLLDQITHHSLIMTKRYDASSLVVRHTSSHGLIWVT